MFGAYSQSAWLVRDVFQSFSSLSIEMTFFDLWKYIRAIGFKIPRKTHACKDTNTPRQNEELFHGGMYLSSLMIAAFDRFYFCLESSQMSLKNKHSISLLLHLVSDLQNVINQFFCRSWRNVFYSHCHVHTGSILSNVNLSFPPTPCHFGKYKSTHKHTHS